MSRYPLYFGGGRGGGGGTPRSIETLFNNFTGGGDAGTTITNITDNSANWGAGGHSTINLGRALVAGDDTNLLHIDWRALYTFAAGSEPVSQKRIAYIVIPVDLFRAAVVNARTSGDAVSDGWPTPQMRVDDNSTNSLGDNHTRMLLFTRGRASGNDTLRVIYAGTPESDQVDTTSIFVRARLIPL